MNYKLHRRRTSYAEIQLLRLIRQHPTGQLSYDTMAAMLDYDRRTLISVVARLREQGRVVVEPGSGTIPNRYHIAA